MCVCVCGGGGGGGGGVGGGGGGGGGGAIRRFQMTGTLLSNSVTPIRSVFLID